MRTRPFIWAAALAGTVLLAAGSVGATRPTSVKASAPKAVLVVSPSAVSVGGDGPGGCVGSNGTTWVCTFKVSETSSSTEPLSWSASVALDDEGDGGNTTFNPPSGTLHPGKSVTVKATVGCWLGMAFLISDGFTGGYEMSGAAVYYMECG